MRQQQDQEYEQSLRADQEKVRLLTCFTSVSMCKMTCVFCKAKILLIDANSQFTCWQDRRTEETSQYEERRLKLLCIFLACLYSGRCFFFKVLSTYQSCCFFSKQHLSLTDNRGKTYEDKWRTSWWHTIEIYFPRWHNENETVPSIW